jgi:hypothetical protein
VGSLRWVGGHEFKFIASMIAAFAAFNAVGRPAQPMPISSIRDPALLL